MNADARKVLVCLLSAFCVVAIAATPEIQAVPSHQLTEADLEAFRQCLGLLDEFGHDVWTAWSAPPLLVAKENLDYLIGHPAAPREAVPLPGVAVSGRDVLSMEGHLVPVPAATAWPVAGIWCVAIPVPDEFQAAVDRVLGEGSIVVTAQAYIRAVVHEAFHAFVMQSIGGPAGIPSFADTGRSPPAGSGVLSDAAALQAEALALASALAATARRDVIAAAGQFLVLRASRRAGSQVDIAAEQTLEWTEGLARYAEIKAWILAGGAGDASRVVPDETWSAFLSQLADLDSMPGATSDLHYVLGAAQAFVLDQLAAEWKPAAMPGCLSLEFLLAEALGAD
jgi:hypothetical protein